MSNLIFNGFNWNSQLIEKFTLQNFFQPQTGETQEMQLPILDYQGNGFKIITQKTQSQSPNLVFRSIISSVETELFKYDTTASSFVFDFPLNLSAKKITNLGTPLISTDAATKAYVDSGISGVPSSIVLTGDVSGSGSTSSSISTTLNKTLNQITNNGNVNISNHLINNVSDPSSPQDVATRNYVDVAVANVAGGVPIGTIVMWGTETPFNASWLALNGQAVSRTTYATLFTLYGIRWGQGDNSTTFNLPDTRGMFPRGWNNGKASGRFDPNAGTRAASATGGVIGDHVGTQQSDDFQSHSHTIPICTDTAGTGRLTQGNAGTSTMTTVAAGGSETRPSNFSILFIIKAL
jgi:microcystin-dependent protein